MKPGTFSPFPILAAGRITLRQLKPTDEAEIFTLRSDKRVLEHLDRPAAATIADARQFIDNINAGIARDEWIYWGIRIHTENHLIGTICLWQFSEAELKAEIGYELLPEYQGKGLMSEALEIVIRFGFEALKLRSIEAEVAPGNAASIKLLEKKSFVRTHFKNDAPDVIRYSLIKGDET